MHQRLRNESIYLSYTEFTIKRYRLTKILFTLLTFYFTAVAVPSVPVVP